MSTGGKAFTINVYHEVLEFDPGNRWMIRAWRQQDPAAHAGLLLSQLSWMWLAMVVNGWLYGGSWVVDLLIARWLIRWFNAA